MADNTKAKKGLPNRAASSHPSHARNQKSWARGENRRAEHRFDQNVRRDVNIARCAGGELTPWQKAKAARAERRSKDPRIIKARRLHMADALSMPTNAGRDGS
jgi:hypothetical protein